MCVDRRQLGVSVLLVLGMLCITGGLAVGPAVAETGHDGPAMAGTFTVDNATASCATDEVRVYGQAVFYGYPYGSNHNYEEYYHPMRATELELIGVSTEQDNETLASTRTDLQGEFEVCLPESDLSSEQDIYAEFTAINPATTVYNEVSIDGGGPYIGRSDIQALNASSDSINLSTERPDVHPEGLPVDPPPALVPQTNNTAFHVADSALAARELFKNHTSGNWTRPSVDIVFPKNRTAYYPPSGGVIFLEDESTYQDSVWHEYGHAIMDTAYGESTTPNQAGPVFALTDNCHWFTTESNYGFALSEGWAIYTSGVMGGWWNDSRAYHTEEAGLCRPFGDAGEYDGYRVEGSITSVLYNLTAEANPDSTAAVPFDTLFGTVRTERPVSIWELYRALRPESDDPEQFDAVFVDHGIDVRDPEIQLSGATTRTVTDSQITVEGTATHRSYNMSAIEYRVAVNGTYGGSSEGATSWERLAGPNQTTFDVALDSAATRTEVRIRASNRWGINATETVVVYRADRLPAVDGTTPRDPDGDGVYTDLDADGETTREDVLTYYQHRESEGIRGAPEFFDYDGDGVSGTVSDALALYETVGE